MLKRWWWAVAVVVVVVAAGAYLMMGGGAQPQTPGSGTATETIAPAPGSSATQSPAPGTPATTETPSTSGTATPQKPREVKLAKKGAQLTTVTVPPTETLAQLKYTAGRDGQTYDVAFRVYGNGPVRAGHVTLVAAVTSFKATKSYPDAVDLPSDNVLLEPGPGASVTVGGSYTGVVTLTRRADALVLVLTSVKAG